MSFKRKTGIICISIGGLLIVYAFIKTASIEALIGNAIIGILILGLILLDN